MPLHLPNVFRHLLPSQQVTAEEAKAPETTYGVYGYTAPGTVTAQPVTISGLAPQVTVSTPWVGGISYNPITTSGTLPACNKHGTYGDCTSCLREENEALKTERDSLRQQLAADIEAQLLRVPDCESLLILYVDGDMPISRDFLRDTSTMMSGEFDSAKVVILPKGVSLGLLTPAELRRLGLAVAQRGKPAMWTPLGV